MFEFLRFDKHQQASHTKEFKMHVQSTNASQPFSNGCFTFIVFPSSHLQISAKACEAPQLLPIDEDRLNITAALECL